MQKAFACLGAVLLLVSSRAGAEQKWAIHEWGTFTSLQNEGGETIGGINTDDEPVPEFVHRLADYLLLRPTEIPPVFFQGAPRCHPDVTMRLETPVIYFHPPASETNVESARVVVKFRGGWLSEYFPAAEPFAPGLRPANYEPQPGPVRLFQFGSLPSSAESRLEWNDLKVGGHWPLTNTSAHVWTSPRAVQSALVQTTNGECEKFLFYRGVAHINAPLKISRDTGTGELLFRSQLEQMPSDKPLSISSIWLVNIQPGGRTAFRSLPSFQLDGDSAKVLARTPASFTGFDFNSSNLEKLKAALQSALVSEGLRADEAQALLNTWELSYFKSPGLRVFFIVPRAWTDFYLPLEVSMPSEINRVMVGRVELVTPDQRKLLQKIARFSTNEISRQASRLRDNFYASPATGGAEWERMTSGRKSLKESFSVPATYQTYLDLGRFRNALILDQAKRSPTAGLTNFIATYGLEAYKPAEVQPGSRTAPE